MEIRDTYDGISKYVIQFTGKPKEIGKSLEINHKTDGEEKRLQKNFQKIFHSNKLVLANISEDFNRFLYRIAGLNVLLRYIARAELHHMGSTDNGHRCSTDHPQVVP